MAFERTVLANGVRVVTAPMDHAESVACVIMLAAGSRFETRETRGIAHFLEHMLFKGTQRRPTARDLSRVVDHVGGVLNAATGKEFTNYYVRCGAQFAPVAFDVLVDMLRNSKLDPAEIEKEKGVIIEEMAALSDTPRDYVDELFEELLFGDQPLGWRIYGLNETVQAATRETFLDYLRWYAPERIVVGAAGRLDDAVRERIERLFEDWEPREPRKPQSFRPIVNGSRVNLEAKDSDQAHVCIGVTSYPITHPDRYVVHVIATLLGGGLSSRLTQEVRERRGLAYSVFAMNYSFTDTGSLYAQAGVDLRRIDDAVATIARELRRIADEPVAEDELEIARNVAKGRFVLQLEAPYGLITFALRREALENDLVEPAHVVAAIDRVTQEDVQRVGQDLMQDGLRLALVGPFDDADRFERLLL